MSAKPQFKIRFSHVIAMVVSTAMWGILIFIFLLLTACLQPVITSAPTQTAAQNPIGSASATRCSDCAHFFTTSEPEQIIIIPAPATSTRTVCAKTLYVRGNPSTMSAPVRYLSRGEVVVIREWDKRGTGWAMIAPAEWINADFLCKE